MDVLSPFISVVLTDSSTGSPVHVLLFTLAVRGFPRLRAPHVVPCIISFSVGLQRRVCRAETLDDAVHYIDRPPPASAYSTLTL